MPSDPQAVLDRIPMSALGPDWTYDPDSGRTNSVPEYVALVAEVGRLMRNSLHVIDPQVIDGTARLIMAQLAHVQNLVPGHYLDALARALAESEERVRVLETALGTVLLRLEDALTVQKAGCNHNGIGRPGCRVCDPRTWTDADVARAALSEPETPR